MKKNILITGSTDGIGKSTAFKLAEEGHTLYLHGRNSKRLNQLIDTIKEETNNNNIYGFVADFADLSDVKRMSDEVQKGVKYLDVLINNAGVFNSPISYSKQGYDIRYAVNYLAPYLLTRELLPLLNLGQQSRIINLSSAAQSEVSYDVLMGKQPSNANASYAQSKLALTMWSYYLAHQLEGITVISVNPGSLLNTKMALEAYGQHWSPVDKGANILYDLALSENHAAHNGDYFDNDAGRYAKAHPDTYNESAVNQLIDVTNKILQ
ncbi:SDR family NAD(P)-dependent oxidoreductase [Flammeovirga agarivorans]|uniref:SDR family NAD(P)-dependent oxidoreductase n=1 Tax=Flammeovirga agarivorans TaxID=2726742 RepID=A0A7X8SQB2_9BACT|nr:SDR family NAD(P)-dependent oxidoreductase [Flammeovirga agarivorans]NLR94356.1 SDR family NAD(P)-dependent oxidoreductase [Flammeovirga agarivorans]